MKIIKFSNTPQKVKKKDLEIEAAKRWVAKQKAIDSKNSIKLLANEIEEIRKFNPDFLVGRTARI